MAQLDEIGLTPEQRARVTVVDHPMVQHKVAILRDESTGTKQFRDLVRELAMFEGYEATRDFPLEPVEVTTPLETCTCHKIAGKKVAVVLGLYNGERDAKGQYVVDWKVLEAEVLENGDLSVIFPLDVLAQMNDAVAVSMAVLGE